MEIAITNARKNRDNTLIAFLIAWGYNYVTRDGREGEIYAYRHKPLGLDAAMPFWLGADGELGLNINDFAPNALKFVTGDEQEPTNLKELQKEGK